MSEFVCSFKNKTALVTGGSSGIGKQIVKDLVYSGCQVVFTYFQNEKAAFELRESLSKQTGLFVKCVKVDLTKDQQIERLIQYMKQLDSIDFLVNNAATLKDKPIQLLNQSDWDDILKVNLSAVFMLTHGLTRKIVVSKGSIVNVSSIAGLMGNAGQTNYSASKAGLIGFTKALSKELGPLGVRVNAVAPGYVLTEMSAQAICRNEKEIIRNTSLRRLGLPSEISSTILFLLSNAASYITGKVITPDGGII